MYEELVKRLRQLAEEQFFDFERKPYLQAADAIEELQATLCQWCAVFPYDKRDLSTCEIYESCHAEPPKEE